MTVHIMLDLETWGTKPGCDIRSIGACVFDPSSPAGWVGGYNEGWRDNIGTFYVACDNPSVYISGNPDNEESYDQKYFLTRDPKTVQWWNDQSDDAKAAFSDPVDLREALEKLDNWLHTLTDADRDDLPPENFPNLICLWAHGPQFDISILDAAYDAVGLPVPWHYRAPRDTRTAFDMAGVGDHSAFMQQYNHGTAHNALHDAISQARAVCGAYKLFNDKLRSAFEAGYATSSEDERNDGTPYPRWGIKNGFRHFMDRLN